MAEYDALYKVIIVGNSCTGKSSILLRLCDNIFTESYLTTIGVDFKIRTFAVDNKKVKLQIWDTAGQERFHNIITSYFKGADAVVIVFDLTDIDSFNSIGNWVSEAQQYASAKSKRYLFGAKSDITDKRTISFEDASNMAKEFKMNYIEVSSKTGSNIQKAFTSLSGDLLHSIPNEVKPTPKPQPSPIPPVQLTPMNEALDQLKMKCC